MKTIKDLFSYINFLAENFHTELYPRYFWQQSANNESACKYVIAFEKFVDQKCCLTDDGLSVAICGKNCSVETVINMDSIQKNELQIENSTEFFYTIFI